MTETRPVRPLALARSVLPIVIAAGIAGPAGAQPDRPETGSRAALEVLVLDRDGRPVAGLTGNDFVVSGRSRAYRVDTAEGRTAGEAPRSLVFVFNRRGADAVQLNRALRGLGSFIEDRMLDADESLFVDMGETLRIGRAFGPGKAVALAGLGTIPAMGYRSPAGAEDDAVVAARMLELVADRLAASAGRKIVVLYSESLSTFARSSGQPGTDRKPDWPRILPHARGASDAGLGAITGRLRTAGVTLHVLHLAGVREFEDRILISERGELYVPGSRLYRYALSSTTFEGRERAVSSRSGDDILSSVAAETGGLYFARTTAFRKALDRIEDRNRFWYRLTLVGEVGAAERESQVLQVRVPGCSGCTVLSAPSSAPE